MRRLLLPLTPLYRAIVWGRNAAFDAGLMPSKRVPVPVISVGNITTGGSGKTPLVEDLARRCLERGMNVGVLSRGYGRHSTGFRWVQKGDRPSSDPRAFGDEPVQIAENVSGAVVAVDENRVDGALRMVNEAKVEALILDDAFQHRWIGRDLDIVVVSRDVLEGRDALLPAGDLREPLSSLRRAGAVVVTGVDAEGQTACRELLRRSFSGPALFAETVPTFWSTFNGVRRPATALGGKRIVALSGIARPGRFRATLASLGCEVCDDIRKPDHHFFSVDEVLSAERSRHRHGADLVVTTQKDAVRLRAVARDADVDPTLWTYVSVGMHWMSHEMEYERLLDAALKRTAGNV
jgi:tetraacyldisaccharide 4'-kinase